MKHMLHAIHVFCYAVIINNRIITFIDKLILMANCKSHCAKSDVRLKSRSSTSIKSGEANRKGLTYDID